MSCESRLPISVSPPIIGKTRHSFPLSILATDDAYLPWFFSNYIQLFCGRARGFPDSTVDFFFPPHYPSLPLLDVQTFHRRVLAMAGAALGPFIVNCIDDEKYVRVFVDESRLPGRLAYGQYYFPHEVLIFGYGPGYFDILGFLANGRYAASQVRRADLETAFHTDALIADVASIEAGTRDRALGLFGEIQLFHRRSGLACEFDPRLVLEQLTDYLQSHNSAERFRLLDTCYYDQEGAGLQVYGCIQRRLQYALQHPESLGFISFHILWEHKKCMLARMKFLRKTHGFDPMGTLGDAWMAIEEETRILRMTTLRFLLHGDTLIIKRAIERLARVPEKERTLIERTIEKLARHPLFR